MAKFATNASGAIWWAICHSCNWRHLVAKFATNASSAIWWPIFQLMQVAPSGGQFATHATGAIWWSILKLMQVVPSGLFFSCNWQNIGLKLSRSMEVGQHCGNGFIRPGETLGYEGSTKVGGNIQYTIHLLALLDFIQDCPQQAMAKVVRNSATCLS